MMSLRVGKDVFDYINEVKVEKAKHAMKKRLQDYAPNPSAIDKLENIDQKYHLIVFSAEWCGDCVAYVPGLAKALAIAKNDMVQARLVDYDNHRDMADDPNIRKTPTRIVSEHRLRERGRFGYTSPQTGR